MHRLRVALRMLAQFGSQPLALYALYRLGLRTGHYHRLDGRMAARAALVASSFRPIFCVPAALSIAATLHPAAKAALRREANNVAAGKIRLFGRDLVDLNLKTRQPLRHWTEYELDPALLADFAAPHSDIKFRWEHARFGWGFALARAFHAFGEERYARAFWTHFSRFDKANPPYLGGHWSNGQEVAIRLTALVWCAQVVAPARASTSSRMARLHGSIAEHAARIPPTLVYARSQDNNHLVTESTALYLAGLAFDHKPWRDIGWRWLNRALQTQIDPAGEYKQHSTNYHRLVLHSALIADNARRVCGDLWPTATQEALRRASRWLLSMLDPASGRVPNLGANDGALILPLCAAPFDDFRPTVQAAARAFLGTAPATSDSDELSEWLALPKVPHSADSSSPGNHLRGPHSWSYLRGSAQKSRLGHMDQLHLDLWWRGINITPDAGTYLYNAPLPWDNPLVTARVHNTVTIDGRDQMTRAGRFLVLDWFPARVESVASVEPPAQGQLSAVHRGYDRYGVRHSRTVSLQNGGTWLVRDSLAIKDHASHTVRLHWLLHDGTWRLRQDRLRTRLEVRLPRGLILLDVTASGTLLGSGRVTLVRAGKLIHGDGVAPPYEGWISPTYAHKMPALSLTVEVRASSDLALTSTFTLPD